MLKIHNFSCEKEIVASCCLNFSKKTYFPKEEKLVKTIVEKVRKEGDSALISYTSQYDKFTIKNLRVAKKEIDASLDKVDENFKKAVDVVIKRVADFHKRQINKSWIFKTPDNSEVGMLITPLKSIGIHVPAGTVPLPSSLIMCTLPAILAGVQRIVVCSPPRKDGTVYPEILYAARKLNLTEIYRIGGAQAISAMAYGTQTINKVDKIVGPGNIFVQLAKKKVFGDVDIDMLAGPSEVLIIADKYANPKYIAVDLLSQIEHGEQTKAFFFTDSEDLAKTVVLEIEEQITKVSEELQADSKNCIIAVFDSIANAAELANKIAPEHVQIMCRNYKSVLKFLKNAGAVFVGEYSPVALGDYVIGTNHVLPTGSTAVFASPLGVYDFVKRSSYAKISDREFYKISKAGIEMAKIEKLQFHRESLIMRNT